MVRLQTNLSDDDIIQRAAKVGVGMMSASIQYINPNYSGEFIFGYGELDEQQLVEGVYRLAQVIKA
ncbi:hypothetical protein [Brunnivagina elsteri]|uniref:GntR family transcriptional regulator n=1 Tax=Brunnivagina elsteri CCALA 953 TaxID=987040 RepID=A0A2A2TAD6_9CYAN|nr:hypothetical protein [Calothrix elsteri]PAX45856.1 hypothetical protein CK510_29455 [Calothrix elsteri CCALA 953]